MSFSEQDLKKTVHGAVRSALNEKEASTPKETTVEHACGCPDCFCSIIDKMNKESDYACADCGLPLGNKEFASKIEKCPNCGGTETREIEHDFL